MTTIAIGSLVYVAGTARAEINGKKGIVVKDSDERGRHVVELLDTKQKFSLKPANLTVTMSSQDLKNMIGERLKPLVHQSQVCSPVPPSLHPDVLATQMSASCTQLPACLLFSPSSLARSRECSSRWTTQSCVIFSSPRMP